MSKDSILLLSILLDRSYGDVNSCIKKLSNKHTKFAIVNILIQKCSEGKFLLDEGYFLNKNTYSPISQQLLKWIKVSGYELIHELGRGSSSVVFKAKYTGSAKNYGELNKEFIAISIFMSNSAIVDSFSDTKILSDINKSEACIKTLINVYPGPLIDYNETISSATDGLHPVFFEELIDMTLDQYVSFYAGDHDISDKRSFVIKIIKKLVKKLEPFIKLGLYHTDLSVFNIGIILYSDGKIDIKFIDIDSIEYYPWKDKRKAFQIHLYQSYYDLLSTLGLITNIVYTDEPYPVKFDWVCKPVYVEDFI